MSVSAMGHSEELRHIAMFAAGATADRLAPEVIEKAQGCLLYGLAVGYASAGVEMVAQTARALDRGGASVGKVASRLIDGQRVTTGAAAFANGVLFHTRMQEDAHPAGHLGVVVLPAALATAEEVGANGGLLLTAIVVGYETALRIGRDHAAVASSRGFRTTPAYGVFGAAAAAGRLYGLDSKQMLNALSLAANFSCGLRELNFSGTGEYAIQAGVAAQNGVIAASLAAEGVEGAASVLGGEAGFFRAYGDDVQDYGRRLTQGLGQEFEFLSITYKPYPGGQFHRGIIRGVSFLRDHADDQPLKTISVRMNPFEANFFGLRYAGPFETYSQAFFSVPFCAALAWVDGNATFAGFHRFDDPRLLTIIPRVELIADHERPRYKPHLKVTMANGRILEWEETEGEDAYRLTWSSAVKMAGLLGDEAGIGKDVLTRLIEAVESLKTASSVDSLIRAACEATAQARNKVLA